MSYIYTVLIHATEKDREHLYDYHKVTAMKYDVEEQGYIAKIDETKLVELRNANWRVTVLQ